MDFMSPKIVDVPLLFPISEIVKLDEAAFFRLR
jgi:hypothetical protein